MTLRLDEEAIPARHGYIPGLDGLRACSIGLVLISHFFFDRGGAGWGALGVWVFFGLSGFLITRLMLAEQKKTGGIAIGAFYLRRFLRLYPVIAAFLAVIVSLALILGLTVPLSEVAGVLFYYINYYMAALAAGQVGDGGADLQLPVGVLWSLAVEEHFYIIMPLVFVALRGDVRKLIMASVIVCVMSLVLRCAYVLIWPETVGKLITYVRSDMRFDSIAIGVLFALLCETRRHREIVRTLSSRPAFAVGILLMFGSLVVRDPFFKETLRFTVRNLATVPILAAVVFGNIGVVQRVLNSAPAVWVGRISYSLYVWHGGVEWMMEHLGFSAQSHLVRGLAFTVVSLIVATASFYLLEQPLIQWRKRLEGRRLQTATAL